MNDLSAVVVAAGSSSRFNKNRSLSQSKQLVQWSGKPLFVHTLEALSILPIEEIVLVIRQEDEEIFHRYLDNFKNQERLRICFGGARRQDSVYNGLKTLAGCNRVLIHDSARPFLSIEMLNELNDMSKNEDAVIPVLPVVDTLKEVNSEGVVVATHDRSKFMRVQTPQFFNYHKLMDVNKKWADSETEFTDDASMMEHAGYKVKVCSGTLENIKVTVPDDLKGRI
jgi:2-C-methyl-D-erythritol 4-phosphate cytidylyltransferase